MSRKSVNKEELGNILIEKLVSGGDGLGSVGGRAVFVPLTAPGDVILPVGVRRSRGTIFVDSYRLITRSSERRVPPCPYFGECGGCNWMHLPYPAQLSWKSRIAAETVRRIGGIDITDPGPVYPSASELGWRHRVRVQNRRWSLGFFRRRSHSMVEWDRCLVIPEVLNRTVQALRTLPVPDALSRDILSVEAAQSPVDGSVSLMWQMKGSQGPGETEDFLDRAADHLSGEGIECVGQGSSGGSGARWAQVRGKPLFLTDGEWRVRATAGSFFQVNPSVNEHLVSEVLGIVESEAPGEILDLYCGIGNFTIPAAVRGFRAVGVDASAWAIRNAAEAFTGETARFEASEVEGYLRNRIDDLPQCVIVDPPRSGLPMAVRDILSGGFIRDLVYVSCEPATLARDLRVLVGSGYRMEKVRLFDMFPNSDHVETLVHLKGKI